MTSLILPNYYQYFPTVPVSATPYNTISPILRPGRLEKGTFCLLNALDPAYFLRK